MEQNSIVNWTAVDLQAKNVFVTKSCLPVGDLLSAIASCFSVEIAHQNCASLERCLDSYGNAAQSFDCLAFYQSKVLPFDTPTLRTLWECSSQNWWLCHWSKKLFLPRYTLMLLIVRNNASFFLFLYLNFIICFVTYTISSLRLMSIIVMLTILVEK